MILFSVALPNVYSQQYTPFKQLTIQNENTDTKKDSNPFDSEEANNVRNITQKFIDALYENPASLAEGDLVHQVTESLKYDVGRAVFGKTLVTDNRVSGVCCYFILFVLCLMYFIVGT